MKTMHLTIQMHDGADLNRSSVCELLEFVAENFRFEVNSNSDPLLSDDEYDILDFDDHDDVRAKLVWRIEVK